MGSTSEKGAREILADAIRAEEDAREALKDAQSAASRAADLVFSTMSVIDDLERQIAEAEHDSGDLIETLARGGDVAELVRSSSSLREKLRAKQSEVDVLRQARDAKAESPPNV